jgi:(p)ppGpp synthase/HD superfamily hydrolase
MTERWVMVLKAANAAAQWHTHQRRKGEAQEPYINHLLEVAQLVAEATEGHDPNLVIAALLHDAIEDCEVSRNDIAAGFGEDVAALVAAVTDDKNLKKEQRKQLQVDGAPHQPRRAKLLKLADKTSNLRALAASPPARWSLERKLDYLAWARAVAHGLRGVNPWLESRFDAAAEAAEQALRATAA